MDSIEMLKLTVDFESNTLKNKTRKNIQTTITLLAETDNGKIIKIFVTPQNDSETQSHTTNSANDVNYSKR